MNVLDIVADELLVIKTDEEEYFAEGCSAFSRDYISHSSLLIPNSINSFMLEDKDPDLYNLINTLLNEDLSHTRFKKG